MLLYWEAREYGDALMAKHRITLIPGDGIGPEVTGAVVKILETAGLDVEWESHLAGALALERTVRRCRRSCSTRSRATRWRSRAR